MNLDQELKQRRTMNWQNLAADKKLLNYELSYDNTEPTIPDIPDTND